MFFNFKLLTDKEKQKLVRFYYRHYNVADQTINRISASLQYFLNNVTTNQPILFEVFIYFQKFNSIEKRNKIRVVNIFILIH